MCEQQCPESLEEEMKGQSKDLTEAGLEISKSDQFWNPNPTDVIF